MIEKQPLPLSQHFLICGRNEKLNLMESGETITLSTPREAPIGQRLRLVLFLFSSGVRRSFFGSNPAKIY